MNELTEPPVSRNHVGIIVDRFWLHIPSDHAAFKACPSSMPEPHHFYLSLGYDVVGVCAENGFSFGDGLTKQIDINAWLRLLGAWVCFVKRKVDQEGKLPSRSAMANEMNMDPSSLTNFLNARRPITLKALKTVAEYIGVKPIDIRTEMGASELYSQERKLKKSMASIRNGLESIIKDAEALESGVDGRPMGNIIQRLKSLASTL